jgi:DNA-binding beta-propeller fold protein YncE
VSVSRSTVVALAVLFAGAFLALGAHARSASVLERLEDVPLPGPAVRFDYQYVDTLANRLYVSHMNAGELVVVDLANSRVVGVVGDLPRVTGVCAVPALGKIYASVPGRREVAVIDARTLKVVARVGSIGFPDGIAYVPSVNRVYVSDESGGGELVIDGRTDRVVATIPLGGEAGNTLFDPATDHVLVAVQTRNEMITIDPRRNRVIARNRLTGADHPHGMALDPARRLLFVANEENAALLTVDLRSMRIVDRHRVGKDPDVLAFDPGWGRLYVASESGEVSVFTLRGRALVSDGNVVLPHAHTVSVDPRTHRVYLPLASVEGKPVLRILTARQP